MTNAAIKRLAFWDGVLRSVKLPSLIYRVVRKIDPRTSNHFIYYIAKTQVAIAEIGAVLNGNKPILEPELKNLSVHQLDVWRDQCLNHLHQLHPKPVQYFNDDIVGFKDFN